MAKELPYFKFEPAEYLTKDVSFCSLAAQGLFINLCSYYWQRSCNLSKDQFLKRLNHEKELDELISEGAIDLIDNDIYINFLDVQFEEVVEKSKTNKTNGSKGGRPLKNPIITEPITEIKPNDNPIESESKGIREDKIKEDKIINTNTDVDVINWNNLISQFNQMMNKKTKVINETVKSSFKARLKEGYSKQDIVLTLENICKDTFHINNGFLHVTLEYVSRQKTIDKYINFKSVKPQIKQDRL